ncbi:hypothetical protein K7X08_003941 [Anisodus acutangulus]|uniref:Uncharacterized protein n=1 Tax=Anisodus acutangulus TaxID=402998 RepID=A0A9Q1MGM5_9SOLA|nr:hypothetical protein K7X08_003941 [Anisodus acutangulus]
MDADEKLAALERVYGDVMLNTEKEAAARIMVSEQKVQCFQKELHVVKENGILAMMKLKKSMDSKVDGGSNTENLGISWLTKCDYSSAGIIPIGSIKAVL